MDYTALRTEIQTDPATLGYAPFIAAGSHNQVAALLDAPRGILGQGRCRLQRC